MRASLFGIPQLQVTLKIFTFANEASAKKDARVIRSSVTLLFPFAIVDHSRGGVLVYSFLQKMNARKRIQA